MARYVALLRGINVGGKNPIPMAGLKTCFEDNGFDDVRTYIQSGNVSFSSSSTNQAELTRQIERMLNTTFAHYDASVVIRSRTQMRAIVDRAPKGFGTQPDQYRYDVIFLKPPLTAKTALKSLSMKEGVDRLGGQRRPVLLATDEPGDVQPPEPGRGTADLSADDDPELEHHDEAARAPRRCGRLIFSP